MALKIDLIQCQLDEIYFKLGHVNDYWFFDDRCDILTAVWEALNGVWAPYGCDTFIDGNYCNADGKLVLNLHGMDKQNIHLVRFSRLDITTGFNHPWKENGKNMFFVDEFEPSKIPEDIRKLVLEKTSKFYLS